MPQIIFLPHEEICPDGAVIEASYVKLFSKNTPSKLLPEAGDHHRFSDAYFLLPAGQYQVRITPMKSNQEKVGDCAPAEQSVSQSS